MKTQPKKQPPKNKLLFCRVPESVHGAVEALSEKEGRSISGMVRRIIERHLALQDS